MSILSILRLGAGPRAQPEARMEPTVDATARAYPHLDPGVQVRSVEDILAAHQDLISRIKLCYGADREAFDADLLVPIRNYAAFVNLLPATSDNFFCEVGGLFRLGLEVAFYALQGTDGHIVSGRATISTRRQLEPRWRHATFIAGLCSELHRTLSQIVVTDEHGEEWPAYLGPLSAWLDKRRANRFFVRWIANAQESRALGLFALPHIVSPATVQHLATANTVAVPQMLSCLAGTVLYREQNVLVDLVKRAAALVIDRDLIASVNRYGRPMLGAHLERYLIDAMRRLVVSHPAWAPNHERSRVWYGREGLFIVWPNAVNEIRKLLEEDELPGIPKAPDTILEILLGAGVFEGRATGQPLWTIEPPPGKTSIEAVKLAAAEILLPSYGQSAAPLTTPLVVSEAPGPAPRTSATLPPREPDLVDTAFAAAELQPDAGAAASDVELPNDTPSGRPTLAPSFDITTENGPPPETLAAPAAPPVLVAPAAPSFKLVAPLRLNPMVRDALAAAIASMNGDAKAADAIPVPAGVFVPFDHFKRHHVDIPVVLRSLAETGMTASNNAARAHTVQHDMHGQPELGIVIKPAFVEGLDPSRFAPSG
jgi:conjugal transfer pilus assembly protein TraI